MLNYFITVTRDLAMPAILIGMLYAAIQKTDGLRGRRVLNIGLVVGFLAAAAIAILKNTTKVIDRSGGTGMWNVYIFAASTLALIVYYVFCIRPLRAGRAGGWIAPASAAVMSITFLAYAMPSVFGYPFNFTLNGDSVFSTRFLYRFAGYVLGILLAILIFVAVYQTLKRTRRAAAAITAAALFINGFQQITKAIQVLHAKRMITGHSWFVLVRFTSNNSDLFIYLLLAAALIAPLALFIKSFRVKEPYENAAQKRKIRAKWRSTRRWALTFIACLALVVLTLTVLTDIDNREVELSPVEESEVRGDNVYVALSKVDDGHLHRFAYTTPNGITVRFIIIKKPNSSSYGVGLDACDICGETGYYERNGQVVCNLCDVVMNINTIGFKGGCNPIVIDYSVEDGYIIVPTYTLIENEGEFK